MIIFVYIKWPTRRGGGGGGQVHQGTFDQQGTDWFRSGLVMLSLELAKSNAKTRCWQVGLQLIMQREPTPLLRALPIGLQFE